MPRLKEMKRKGFILRRQDMKEEIGIEVTFTLEMKLQKFIF